MTLPTYLNGLAINNPGGCGGRAFNNPPPMDPYERCVAQYGLNHPKCVHIRKNAPQHVRDRVAAQYGGLALENPEKLLERLERRLVKLKARRRGAKTAARKKLIDRHIKVLNRRIANAKSGKAKKRGRIVAAILSGGASEAARGARKRKRARQNPLGFEYGDLALMNRPETIPQLKAAIAKKKRALRKATKDNQPHLIAKLRGDIRALESVLKTRVATAKAHKVAGRADLHGLALENGFHGLALENSGYGAMLSMNPQDPVPHLKALIADKQHKLQYAVQDGQIARVRALREEIRALSQKLEEAMAVSLKHYQSTGTEFAGAREAALTLLEKRLANLKARRKKARTATRKKLIDAQIRGTKRKIARAKKRLERKASGQTLGGRIRDAIAPKKAAKRRKKAAAALKTEKGKGKRTGSRQIVMLKKAHASMVEQYQNCEDPKSRKCKRLLKEIRKNEGLLKKAGASVEFKPLKVSTSVSSASTSPTTMTSYTAETDAYTDDSYDVNEYTAEEATYTPSASSSSAYDYDTSSWDSSGGGGSSYSPDSYEVATTEEVDATYDDEDLEEGGLGILHYALIGTAVAAAGGGGWWLWRRRKARKAVSV